MKVSSVVVTKPGGLTTAEALATGLPMVIVNPIPGQEAMNAKYLLEKGVAVKIDDYRDISIVIESLLGNGGKLARMRINALQIAKPESSRDIARLMLDMLKNSKISAPSIS
jgi:processive 1,2-diacylglycerol beta-glucosyltransferase